MSSKYNKLAGKHVLILGGSSGIGRCVAEAALAAGANVTISSSSRARVDAAAAALAGTFPGRTVRGLAVDLSRPTVEADLVALFEAVGPVDHIVYTAADALALGPLDGVDVGAAHQAAHMRLVVPLLLGKAARAALPRTRHASLTLTTGTVAERPGRDWALVAFLAGGLQSLTRALAVELAPVRVNAVRPGIVATGLWDANMDAGQKQAMLGAVGEQALTGAAGEPEDVAEAYLWLMKDGNVTGTVAATDGGALLV